MPLQNATFKIISILIIIIILNVDLNLSFIILSIFTKDMPTYAFLRI